MPKYRRRPYKKKRKSYVPRRISMTQHKHRCTALLDVTSDTAASSLGEINFNFKDFSPNTGIGGRYSTGTVGLGQALSSFTQLAAVFDVFRPQYCKMTYTPNIVKNQPIANNAIVGNVPSLYISHDPDNNDSNQPVTTLIRKVTTQRKDLTKSWTFSWKPKRLNNTEVDTVILSGGWINAQGPFPQEGEVQMRGNTPLQDSKGVAAGGVLVGTILVEYYLEFKSPR